MKLMSSSDRCLEDEHGVGGCQVQTHATRLQRHQHHSALWVVLESLHGVILVSHLHAFDEGEEYGEVFFQHIFGETGGKIAELLIVVADRGNGINDIV